jgi:hypothetical protein
MKSKKNWETTYMNAKYNPGKWFQGKEVIKKNTRKIKHDHFPKLPHLQQLINSFENLHNDMRVTEVWFLNSLTAKSVLAGEKTRSYVLNFYVGIVHYILHETKTWHAKIYLPTQCTNQQILILTLYSRH